MNLYELHTNPETLAHYDEIYKMPGEAWTYWVHSLKDTDTSEQEFLWPWVMKDPESAYLYAVWVGGRVPEAEDAIKSNATWARKYATKILQRRWPEAEEVIGTNDLEWDMYYEEFGTR